MSRHQIIAAVALWLLVGVPEAQSRLRVANWLKSPVEIGTTSTLLFEYRHDNFNGSPGAELNEDDRLLNLLGRINLNASWSWFSASVRLDGLQMLYREHPCSGPSCRVNIPGFDYRVGEFQVSFRSRYVTVTGGHVTAQFGRGLVLSLRKVDELGVDLSLLGGRAQLRYRDYSLVLVGGLVNANEIDYATLNFSDDPFDLLAGARAEGRLLDRFTVGAHFVFVQLNKTPDLDGFSRTYLPGVSVSFPQIGPHLTLEVEGALSWHDASLNAEGLGYGIFGALTGIFGKWTTLLEFKHYSKFRSGSGIQRSLLYHEPPSLERLDQQTPNNSNVFGGRLRASVGLFGDEFTPSINVLVYAFNDNTTEDMLRGDSTRLAYHTYVQFEQKLGPVSLTASFGIRRDFFINRPEDPHFPRLKRLVYRTDGSFSVPLGKHSIEAKWEHRWEQLNTFSTTEFLKGRATVTYGFAPHFTFALLASWDTSALEEVQPRVLLGAEAQVKFGRWGQIKLFGGGLHGGLVCVSGSCRNIPTFTGVRTELVFRL